MTELLEPLRGLTVPNTLPQLAARLAVPKPLPAQEASPTASNAPNANITRVRELLRGREMVIVGGDERKETVTQLEAAFNCRVRWLGAASHTSLSVFEPVIPGDVAVVLLLIRWSCYVCGELVHACKARGVPVVRLVGYNPNRVARDVLEQARERLSFAHADPETV